jgi:hypothetical protein
MNHHGGKIFSTQRFSGQPVQEEKKIVPEPFLPTSGDSSPKWGP